MEIDYAFIKFDRNVKVKARWKVGFDYFKILEIQVIFMGGYAGPRARVCCADGALRSWCCYDKEDHREVIRIALGHRRRLSSDHRYAAGCRSC